MEGVSYLLAILRVFMDGAGVTFSSEIYPLSVDQLTETKGDEMLGSHVVMVTIAGVMLQEEGALPSTHIAWLGAMLIASLHDFSR